MIVNSDIAKNERKNLVNYRLLVGFKKNEILPNLFITFP